MEKRLSAWKGKHLSIGEWLILIKSVLSSLSVDFPSVFWCLETVIKVESIQKRFLRNDILDNRKFHLVPCNLACKVVEEGGLDIRSIRCFNIALLGKWLWRLGIIRKVCGR